MREIQLLLNDGSSSAKSVKHLTNVGSLLHGDDAKLIFFIHPDEEGLGVVVEDTTATGPVALQATGCKILVVILEEEVILLQLLLFSSIHGLEWVELAFEITIERLSGLDDFFHDLKSVCLVDARAKRVRGEVAADTDTSGIDHSSFIWREGRSNKVFSAHFRMVNGIGLVSMVVLNDPVKERSERPVRVVTTCVDTDARSRTLGS